jgi:hypothetical protein
MPAGAPAATPRTRDQLLAEAEAGLARLRALQVVQVYDLVLELPRAALQCYGPCWSTHNDVIVAEYERQLPRLRKLAEVGESVLANSYPTVAKVEEAPAAISSLESLKVVDLGKLLTVAPKSNPSCYNLPCPEDTAAAQTENESRAWFVRRWSQMAAEKL